MILIFVMFNFFHFADASIQNIDVLKGYDIYFQQCVSNSKSVDRLTEIMEKFETTTNSKIELSQICDIYVDNFLIHVNDIKNRLPLDSMMQILSANPNLKHDNIKIIKNSQNVTAKFLGKMDFQFIKNYSEINYKHLFKLESNKLIKLKTEIDSLKNQCTILKDPQIDLSQKLVIRKEIEKINYNIPILLNELQNEAKIKEIIKHTYGFVAFQLFAIFH